MSQIFDLATYILSIRPDLRRLFPAADPASEEGFLQWQVTCGIKEYRVLHEDPTLRRKLSSPGHGPGGCLTLLQHCILQVRPDLQKALTLPQQLPAFYQWFYTRGVEEMGYWSLLSAGEQAWALALPEPWGSRLRTGIVEKLPLQPPRVPFVLRPFGVNVIGYAFGQLGIGEDARMAARALQAAGVPMTMVNFPPGQDVPQNDHSMAACVSEQGDYAINLFCMTAEETARFYATHGSAQLHDRYNIGYWPWELGKWPKAWEMALALVDEVWVSTRHTHSALAPHCSKPLQLMPMAVALGEIQQFSSRKAARKHFQLPAQATLFCFAFDLNSWVQRKNPQACVAAFLKAFPKSRFGPDAVGLVIKVGKPAPGNRHWAELKAQVARDPRIHVIEQTLPRAELLALYKACDCFLSLHRAEGFGRGLAEALQLGLHVICTGYSGNVDFCQPPYADLVRYTLVKLRKHDYVHSAGQVWAEPDVKHAAQLMRSFAEAPPSRRKRLWPQFAPATVGSKYRERLEALWQPVGVTAQKKLYCSVTPYSRGRPR